MLYFTTYTQHRLLNVQPYKKWTLSTQGSGSNLLWNLGFSVGYGISNSFTSKSNYLHSLVPGLFSIFILFF